MQRTPEPAELMDEAAQAKAYAEADFSDANTLFVTLLEQHGGASLDGRVLDLGCGPADIPMTLATRHPGLDIDALDGARAMLDLAARRLDARRDIALRLRLLHDYLPSSTLPRRHYRYLVSNSLLHHLADPGVLWDTIKHCGEAGAQVLVMDLARPSSVPALDGLVETYAIDAPEVLRRDFRNSLMAAYTPDEVRDQLCAADLAHLEVGWVSDRHLAVRGALATD